MTQTIRAEVPMATDLHLSPRQQCALAQLSRGWVAGPELPDHVLDELGGLRAAGLVERRFGDQGDPTMTIGNDAISFKIRSCWYFKLTPKGIDARNVGDVGP